MYTIAYRPYVCIACENVPKIIKAQDYDVTSYDVIIVPLPGSKFGRAFGPSCVYSEKRPGRAAAETTSRGRPNARPFLAAHLAFCAFTVSKRPGSAAARPGPAPHCKRGLCWMPDEHQIIDVLDTCTCMPFNEDSITPW